MLAELLCNDNCRLVCLDRQLALRIYDTARTACAPAVIQTPAFDIQKPIVVIGRARNAGNEFAVIGQRRSVRNDEDRHVFEICGGAVFYGIIASRSKAQSGQPVQRALCDVLRATVGIGLNEIAE